MFQATWKGADFFVEMTTLPSGLIGKLCVCHKGTMGSTPFPPARLRSCVLGLLLQGWVVSEELLAGEQPGRRGNTCGLNDKRKLYAEQPQSVEGKTPLSFLSRDGRTLCEREQKGTPPGMVKL